MILLLLTRQLIAISTLLQSSLDNVKTNLFLKSYGPIASFHKVIKLLKFKFHIASHATISISSAIQLPGCLLLARDPLASTEESGMLTADEIQSLDLRGLRLAFLKCCYCGAGSVFAEGLVGPFLYDGAHEVVVSMRPVSDSQTTCYFAKQFFEEYLDKWRS